MASPSATTTATETSMFTSPKGPRAAPRQARPTFPRPRGWNLRIRERRPSGSGNFDQDRGRCRIFRRLRQRRSSRFVHEELQHRQRALPQRRRGALSFPVPDAGGLANETFGIGFGSIVAFADYDLDGFMDLVIDGDGNTLQLDHNEGDGTFPTSPSAPASSRNLIPKASAWGDYDNDGLPDLFVARADQGTPGIIGASLYHNNGDGTLPMSPGCRSHDQSQLLGPGLG